VLVGVDGSPAGRDAIALGAMLWNAHGKLTLVHVSVSSSATYLSVDPKPARAEAREMLERERAQAGVIAEARDIGSLSVGRGLHRLAEQSAADLLVVGSCSRGILGGVFTGDDTRASLNGLVCGRCCAAWLRRIDREHQDRGRYIQRRGRSRRSPYGCPGSGCTLRRDHSRADGRQPIPGGRGYWEAFDPH
jgi:nucleotide-binding universal stress UspA family protein